MIRVILLFGLLLIIDSAPVRDDAASKVISYVNTSDGKGNYKFSFETSNGISRDETGTVVNEGQPNQHISVQGFISYTDPEDNIQKISYVADENGYKIVPETDGGIDYHDEDDYNQDVLPPHVVATLIG